MKDTLVERKYFMNLKDNIVESLIFTEDDNFRKFTSSAFNFILNKDDGSAFSWGKTENETPLYNPISPEEIEIVLNDTFTFNKNKIAKFLNLNIGENNFDKNTSISCINSINIIVNNANENEVKKLFTYLNDLNIIAFLNVNYINNFSLRDVFKIKLFGTNNIILNIENQMSNFDNSIKMLIENDFFVKCKFNVNDDNLENVINILKNENYSKTMYTLINFQKTLKKKNLSNLINYLKTKKDFLIFIEKNNYNKYIKYEACSNEYRPCLDSCVIDFSNGKIYPSFENIDIFVNINDINSISDYWNSKEFSKFRKPIVNKLKKLLIVVDEAEIEVKAKDETEKQKDDKDD
jgi:hypothetical protein